MIERLDFGVFDVHCDSCDYSDSYEVDDNWTRLMKEMQDYGWTSKKVDGEWQHECSTCNGKAEED